MHAHIDTNYLKIWLNAKITAKICNKFVKQWNTFIFVCFTLHCESSHNFPFINHILKRKKEKKNIYMLYIYIFMISVNINKVTILNNFKKS